MTQEYIRQKIVTAWESEAQNGDAGYAVKYEDGYTSWIPKEVFEKAYQGVNEGMSFGGAIFMLKRGCKVARKGWNGKNMWLILIKPGNAMHTSTAGAFEMLPCIGMKTADNKLCPGWLASQTDMLADDWVIAEEKQ